MCLFVTTDSKKVTEPYHMPLVRLFNSSSDYVDPIKMLLL